MKTLLVTLAVALAGVAVAVADALVKRAVVEHGLAGSFASRPMWLVYPLYFVQIAFFAWAFAHRAELGLVGILQMVFYAATVLAIGHYGFGEVLSARQSAGVALALAGVVLMNL